MSIIKVDTIKDETGANTLVTQSGSNFAWGAGVPAGTVIKSGFVTCSGSDVSNGTTTYEYATGVTSGAITFTAGNSILIQCQSYMGRSISLRIQWCRLVLQG